MTIAATSLLYAFAALSILALGLVVLLRNPRRNTHIAFAVLCTNLACWTIGVGVIIQCTTAEAAAFWIRATFVVSAFFPATFYQFIGLFPRGRFDGVKWFLAVQYVSGFTLAGLALFSPWYIEALEVTPDGPPRPTYGPVFIVFVVLCVITFFVMHANLFRKLRESSGLERRQIQHVLLAIFWQTLLSSLLSMGGPVLGFESLEGYGPIFVPLMTGIFAYAMIRYHLMDIWVIVSVTTVYAVVTGLVILIFFGAIAFVHFAIRASGTGGEILSTFLAALVIALVLEPIKERIQLLLNRVLLNRRYDVHQLLARASKKASETVDLVQLLKAVCDDISQTMGIASVRVLLVDERNPNQLVMEHATKPLANAGAESHCGDLIRYLKEKSEPLVLEELMHTGAEPLPNTIVSALKDLEAQLCLPLKRTSGLIGLLTLGQKRSKDIFTADDLVAFTALATPLATAIENARLYRKLDEAYQHRARILSQMRGGVVAVDTDGNITTINRGATEMLGPIDLGQPMTTLASPIGRILERTLRDRRAISDIETVIPHPSGGGIPAVLSSSCLTTSENQMMGAMVMIYDLTQVKRLEQNVQRAHRLSSIGTLAAGMAHEIKNPLVSIKTFSQLLPDRYDDPDFRNTFTDIVPNEVERIDSIVTRLLHFARPRPASFAHQNVRAIIDEVLTLVENQLRKGNVIVETDYPEGPVDVIGDEQLLHQVFLNLVLNAVDAMTESTTRRMCVRVEYDHAPPRTGLDALGESESVKISISDSGCGISAEGLERIFTPFYTTKDDGTGLGLSVVHGIVTEHNGNIYVHSSLNQGTTFVIQLPSARCMTASQSM